MKKISLLFTMLMFCEIYVCAQNNTTALSVLSKKEPTIKWNAKSLIKGDFDYDGIADFALRGRKGKIFVLGIVKGALNTKSKSKMLEFGEDSGDQGSLCSVEKAIINTDDIDKDYMEFAKDYLEPKYVKALARLPKASKGIIVSDGMCDPFHIFWDKQTNKFIWWRV
jgi:hypothetical protein